MTTEAATDKSLARPECRASRSNDFGVCPTCRRQNGHLSIGRDHWVICLEHKVKWNIGSNLFSTWRHLTQEQQLANANLLAGFREVRPFHLLDHGTAEEIAAYHAGVAEVERIAASAGFTVEIRPWRAINDPHDWN